MSRACDAIGCATPTSSGRFMCIRHWRMVPVDLQRTINTRYRLLRKDFGFLSDLAYLNACVAAIDAIAEHEGKQGNNTYRRLLLVAQRRQQRGAEQC